MRFPAALVLAFVAVATAAPAAPDGAVVETREGAKVGCLSAGMSGDKLCSEVRDAGEWMVFAPETPSCEYRGGNLAYLVK